MLPLQQSALAWHLRQVVALWVKGVVGEQVEQSVGWEAGTVRGSVAGTGLGGSLSNHDLVIVLFSSSSLSRDSSLDYVSSVVAG